MRRLQVFTAIVMMLCLLALVVSPVASHGVFFASVLFFPVFLFGLLDLGEVFRDLAPGDDERLSPAPVLDALFQRPPPIS
jgi:membrane associated rhomboid family serine protease